MTPKEKAFKLVDLYSRILLRDKDRAIDCAFITINELLEANIELMENAENVRQYRFLEEVKKEIENL